MIGDEMNYPNGIKKVDAERDPSGDAHGMLYYSLSLYDDKGNCLFDDFVDDMAGDWWPEETYDSQGRLICSDCPHDGKWEYDYKNNIVTHSLHDVYTKYKMNKDGTFDRKADLLSKEYIGETGRKIDLMNNGVEKLLQELNIKCKFADDTYRLA
jgi:hypothetical protein